MTAEPLHTKLYLLKIFEFIPHSKIIINLSCVNRLFHHTITGDFKLFYDYTLKIDCGRRGSFLGRQNKGILDSKGRAVTTKSSEIVINDKHKSIVISTSNKPLRSSAVRNALIAISKTSINRLHFRRYRISDQSLSAPTSTATSPMDGTITTTLYSNNRRSMKLPSIHEHGKLNTLRNNNMVNNNNNNLVINTMDYKSHKPKQLSIIAADSISHTLNQQTPDTFSNPRTPSLNIPTPHAEEVGIRDSPELSYSSQMIESSINSDIMELSLPSTSSTNGNRYSKLYGNNNYLSSPNDNQFEDLLQILNNASFEALTIGEECVSWTWQTLMTVLQKFNSLQHLAVHINLNTKSMPNISNEQEWLNFIGLYFECVSPLKSIWCNDDGFLRCMRSLTTYKYLGNNLTFIQDNDISSSYKNDFNLKEIQTESYDDMINITSSYNNLNGHFIRKKKKK
eukprot:163938_1